MEGLEVNTAETNTKRGKTKKHKDRWVILTNLVLKDYKDDI